MVVDNEATTRTDRFFHALADRTRRDILAMSLTGGHSVSQLARQFPISFAAVQKHVAVLAEAGLVTKQRQGRKQRVTGNPEALLEVHTLLDQLETTWRQRIDRLGDLLAEPEEGAPE